MTPCESQVVTYPLVMVGWIQMVMVEMLVEVEMEMVLLTMLCWRLMYHIQMCVGDTLWRRVTYCM